MGDYVSGINPHAKKCSNRSAGWTGKGVKYRVKRSLFDTVCERPFTVEHRLFEA